MKSTPKWLLIPPVVALLLVLGPLAMSGGAGDGQADPTTTPAAAQPAPAAIARTSSTSASMAVSCPASRPSISSSPARTTRVFFSRRV